MKKCIMFANPQLQTMTLFLLTGGIVALYGSVSGEMYMLFTESVEKCFPVLEKLFYIQICL